MLLDNLLNSIFLLRIQNKGVFQIAYKLEYFRTNEEIHF